MTEAKEAAEIASQVAGMARELLRGAVDNVGQVRSKQAATDLVTEWDTRVEDLIRERLSRLTPGIPILAEERGASGEAGTHGLWLVDPIDGTVNFAHGIPMFAVSIGLEVDGRGVVGVVDAPAMDWHFQGWQGGGAYMNGSPIRVSETPLIAEAALATGFPYDRATNPNNNFARWEHFQRIAGCCRRFGAASLDLCMVARGWLDGYWETRLSPWDLAAGAVLVAEAGGRVTGIAGENFDSHKGHVVASNGAIHPELLTQLQVVA